MQVFKRKDPGMLYRDQLQALLFGLEAHDITVKGRPTKEILNAVTVLEKPLHRMQIVPGRRMNPWLALSESLWMLAGREDVAALLPYNKRILDFSDDSETLYGACGYRIRDQIEPLLARLQADPNDRRAVLSIWNPADLTAETKDPPCNDMVGFKLRRGHLHMTVFNRSNDLHWGLHAVNIPQFGILLEYLAARLGVAVGTQTHISQSLHVYLDEPAKDITYRMIAAWQEPIGSVAPSPFFEELPICRLDGQPSTDDLAYLYTLCDHVLDGKRLDEEDPPFFQFAHDFLQCYREKQHDLSMCRHFPKFQAWIAAGEEFWG
jgi:thymidylate synthase